MANYLAFDVPKDAWGQFKLDIAGRPIIYSTNSITQLVDGNDIYDFRDKTRLNFVYLLGVGITIPQETAQLIIPSLTCATEAVISTLKLNLRNEEDIAVENMPLTKLIEANSNGILWQGYQGVANIAESELRCVNPDAQINSTAVELHWYYLKLTKLPKYAKSSL